MLFYPEHGFSARSAWCPPEATSTSRQMELKVCKRKAKVTASWHLHVRRWLPAYQLQKWLSIWWEACMCCGRLPPFLPCAHGPNSGQLWPLPCQKGRLCCRPVASPQSPERWISFCSVCCKPKKQTLSARCDCSASQGSHRVSILGSLLLWME